jgi:hypothetical protein
MRLASCSQWEHSGHGTGAIWEMSGATILHGRRAIDPCLSRGVATMGDMYKQIVVNCMITAHASPRWKGARSEQQRVANNEQLALQRAEAVKKIIEQKLRNKLQDYSLKFLFDQTVSDEDSLPDNSVVIGALGRGQRDSIVAAKGNRSSDDEFYRRVDIDVRIAPSTTRVTSRSKTRYGMSGGTAPTCRWSPVPDPRHTLPAPSPRPPTSRSPSRPVAGGRRPRVREIGGYSLRISLNRAIASSTACSGVRPSTTTRWTAFRQVWSLNALSAPVPMS